MTHLKWELRHGFWRAAHLPFGAVLRPLADGRWAGDTHVYPYRPEQIEDVEPQETLEAAQAICQQRYEAWQAEREAQRPVDYRRPVDEARLNQFSGAYHHLKAHGWREMESAPRDAVILVVVPGSHWVFQCVYREGWQIERSGGWETAQPCLWRALGELR